MAASVRRFEKLCKSTSIQTILDIFSKSIDVHIRAFCTRNKTKVRYLEPTPNSSEPFVHTYDLENCLLNFEKASGIWQELYFISRLSSVGHFCVWQC
jgi:hypothetical protein